MQAIHRKHPHIAVLIKNIFNDLIRGRLEFNGELFGDISIAKDIDNPFI